MMMPGKEAISGVPKNVLKKVCSYCMRWPRNSGYRLLKVFFLGKEGNPLYVCKLNCFFTSDWKWRRLEYLSRIWKAIPPGANTLIRYST